MYTGKDVETTDVGDGPCRHLNQLAADILKPEDMSEMRRDEWPNRADECASGTGNNPSP